MWPDGARRMFARNRTSRVAGMTLRTAVRVRHCGSCTQRRGAYPAHASAVRVSRPFREDPRENAHRRHGIRGAARRNSARCCPRARPSNHPHAVPHPDAARRGGVPPVRCRRGLRTPGACRGVHPARGRRAFGPHRHPGRPIVTGAHPVVSPAEGQQSRDAVACGPCCSTSPGPMRARRRGGAGVLALRNLRANVRSDRHRSDRVCRPRPGSPRCARRGSGHERLHRVRSL